MSSHVLIGLATGHTTHQLDTFGCNWTCLDMPLDSLVTIVGVSEFRTSSTAGWPMKPRGRPADARTKGSMTLNETN
jgi:hypothetical protein